MLVLLLRVMVQCNAREAGDKQLKVEYTQSATLSSDTVSGRMLPLLC